MWPGTVLDSELQLPWETLRGEVRRHGTRNSLLLAVMPTASTSQIFGNVESIEPFYTNYYSRKTKAGEFFILNPYLVRDLQVLGLWQVVHRKGAFSVPIRERIFQEHGSVQHIQEIPETIRAKYKT
jgi:ribonucleotide reductase alpha subunit